MPKTDEAKVSERLHFYSTPFNIPNVDFDKIRIVDDLEHGFLNIILSTMPIKPWSDSGYLLSQPTAVLLGDVVINEAHIDDENVLFIHSLTSLVGHEYIESQLVNRIVEYAQFYGYKKIYANLRHINSQSLLGFGFNYKKDDHKLMVLDVMRYD